jgi:murein DD-endopeptidase MepM/ murein hydrolase activator NlpD
MAQQRAQRRTKSRSYEILIIPQGDGGHTRSIKASSTQLALWGGAVCVAFFLIYFLLFRYTPLGIVVGADPSLRSAVDSVESETRRRVQALAEEVAVLRNYNIQLRKALGQPSTDGAANEQRTTQEAARTPEPLGEQFTEQLTPPTPAAMQVAANVEGLKASFPLFTPVAGVLTRGFEPAQRHFGIDLAAKQGTPVHAAAQGYVVFAGWTFEDGNVVMLSHGSGYLTVYKHNSSLLKSTGSLVKRGEVIALVGSTGITSTGPHLHFEVLKDGLPQNPQEFLLTAPKL